MDILNPPKEEQKLDTDGGDAVQYQQRNRDDDKPKKRKGKSGMGYDQARTEFLIWSNGSAPVGEVKRFAMRGTIRYFEKTDGGSVELSMKQYNERNDRNAEKTYGRIQRQINGTADSDEFAQRNMSASLDRNRNTGRTALVSGKTFGEELRNDTGRSLSDSSGDNRRIAIDSDEVQNQQRTRTLTDLEVLEMAEAELELANLEAGEREALGILKKHLESLKKIQDERAAQGRLYRQQQFGTKVDRAEAEKTLNRMKVLDGQIQRAKAEVLSIENKEVLSKVLQKARKVVETKQWEKDQESLKRWRDRRNNADAIRKYRTRLKNDVDELTNWVLHPNNKDVVKHIPEVLKDSVIPFLSSVDFTSKRQLRGGDAVQYQQRNYSHEVRYDDENANREEAQNAATGLAGKQNTAGSGRTLLPATAEKIWQGIGREKQEQIIDQLDLYTYISEEADLYLFGSADASSLDARTNILEETAKQFYAAMHADRILLENDGRFRWLGENISLLIKDIESIEAGTFSIDEDFEQYQQRHKVLTNREVLEMAMNDLQLSDLTPGERTALDILKGRLEHLKDLQGQRKQQGQLRTPVAISGKARFQNGWTKVGQNWYKNSGYFYCPESVQCTVCSL